MNLAEPSDAPHAAIETFGLTKRFGTLTAVDDLNLEVPLGSVFGLIGPNGAGKTTTFHILTTLLRPTLGEAEVLGFCPWESAEDVRKALGFMPDFFGVYDDVRVSEYLDFFARAYRVSPASRDSLIADLLDLIDLSNKAEDFVDSLSRGMKQRLGLARALIHDPKVLILDEPASGLDPRARVELRELILELQRMGKTVLISTHILSELEEVCSHVGVIEAGRLLVQGPTKQILSGVAQGRVFRVKLADMDSAQRTLDLLASDPSVSQVQDTEDGIRFVLTGGDGAAAAVLSKMAAGGIPIVEFIEDRAGLEDLFMNITKGIVQ